MKANLKKWIPLTLSLVAVVAMTACGSRTLSNEYVKVTQYKNLEIPRIDATAITDDNVNAMITNSLNASAVTEEITDRPAEDGDTVVIDFTGSIDGVPFDGGAATGFSLVLGSGRFIGATDEYKGFEEQIVGHNVGDEFDIEVQFPDPYTPNEDMAGKVATFHIVLNGISRTTVPELTDAWVQSQGGEATTVDEYREEVRKSLEERNQQSIDSQNQANALQALLDHTEVLSTPDDQIQAQIDLMTTYYKNLALTQNMEFADFLQQFMGMDEENFNSQVAIVAEQAVIRNIAAQLVSDHENLGLSEEAFQEKATAFVTANGFTSIDEYNEIFGEQMLRDTLMQQEVSAFLVKHARFVNQQTTTGQSSTPATNEAISEDQSTDDQTTENSSTDDGTSEETPAEE